MKKIGIIGLGIMGHGMALNFLKSGYPVAIWNRDGSKAVDLVKRGAELLRSPKDVTKSADIVFEVVADDNASRAVWFGEVGILAGASKDKVLITSATLSLDYLDELIEATKSSKLRLLDMPLTGSRAGAETGNLKLLAGGDPDVIESIRTALDTISATLYYFGPIGSGMRFKLILNMLMAIHATAASQAAVLATKSGLDPKVVKEAIMDGMAPASPFTGLLFDSLEHPQTQTRFAIKLLEKDLRYAQRMAKRFGLDFDLLNDVQKDFVKAEELGLSDQDWSKIINVFDQK